VRSVGLITIVAEPLPERKKERKQLVTVDTMSVHTNGTTKSSFLTPVSLPAAQSYTIHYTNHLGCSATHAPDDFANKGIATRHTGLLHT